MRIRRTNSHEGKYLRTICRLLFRELINQYNSVTREVHFDTALAIVPENNVLIIPPQIHLVDINRKEPNFQ